MSRQFLRTRFAPSPTGWLHRGHVLNALWTWGLARRYECEVVLRIEDHDRGRCRKEYTDGILRDLDWLGFTIQSTCVQSARTELYHHYLDGLREQGLLYQCRCSRKAIALANPETSSGQEPRYPGTCRNLGLSDPPYRATRVRLQSNPVFWQDLLRGPAEENPEQRHGDPLLVDRDGQFTYQFCAVVDDLEQCIGLVVRGEDLLASTARQITLATMLGRKIPPSFAHHPLLLDASGRKLSKRDHAASIYAERKAGISLEQLLGEVCAQAGWIADIRKLELDEALDLVPVLPLDMDKV